MRAASSRLAVLIECVGFIVFFVQSLLAEVRPACEEVPAYHRRSSGIPSGVWLPTTTL
jgi:hypothetical protein